jgi:hypothetical protein
MHINIIIRACKSRGYASGLALGLKWVSRKVVKASYTPRRVTPPILLDHLLVFWVCLRHDLGHRGTYMCATMQGWIITPIDKAQSNNIHNFYRYSIILGS